MATTTTTAKKKTTTAKRATAPKPKAVVDTPVAPARPLEGVQFTKLEVQPAAPAAQPTAPISDAERAEQAIDSMNAIIRDEDRVMFRTPHDPRGEAKLFERSFNGRVIVLFSDTLYSLPKSIVKAIKKQIRIHELSEMTMAEFTTKNGKFLG